MIDTKYIDIINSKSFDELLEGYKTTLSLVKKIDKDGYKDIIKSLKWIYKNRKKEFEEMITLMKNYWENKNEENYMKLYHFGINEELEEINIKEKPFSTDVEVYLEEFPNVEIERSRDYILGMYKSTVHSVTPLFKEIIDCLPVEPNSMHHAFEFYIKGKDWDINMACNDNEYYYKLYKSKEGNLMVNKCDLDYNSKEIKVRK